MQKPVIGISGSLIIDQGGMFPGYRRSYVNHDYILSVIQAGGVPFIIPFNEDLSVIEEQVNNIDGLILSGGHDVTPCNYGKEPSQKLGGIFPERDTFDIGLLKAAEERELPILGVCRGTQIMNAYHGGTICQDLSEFKEGLAIKHDQGQTPTMESHNVNVLEDSKLFGALAKKEATVNSFHHQVLEKVPANFVVTARASDGVVECIENKEYGWEVGVQWHPEMLHATNEGMANLFGELIKQAKK